MKLKVTHVDTCSFQRSEATNINDQMERVKLKLGPNEAAILFSMMGNQVILIKRPETITLGTRQRRMYVSTRVRVDGGTWYQNLVELFGAFEAFGLDVTALRSKILEYATAIGKHVERQRLRSVG